MRLRHTVPLVLPLVLSSLLAAPATGQPGATRGATPSGATQARVDAVFRFVAPGAPGCGVGVYHDGHLAWWRGYGLASLEHQVPITADTVFDIGSTGKQFTAALTLLLVADGALTLDTPVRRVLPELPAWGDLVTVRHLLHHTGGVRDYLTLFRLAGVRDADYTSQQDAMVMIARQQELDFAPGTAFSYSNSGYLLLAEMVTRLSRAPLATVAGERLFGPLGMADTRYLDAYATVVPRRAWGYAPAAAGFVVSMSNFEQVGDGAVQTSLRDLAAWVRNYERPTVGGAALVRELETTTTVAGAPHPYARGLRVDTLRGLRRVRHGGSWAGFRAELARLPDRRLGVAVLCNREDADPVSDAERVLEALLDEAGVPGGTSPAATAPAAERRGAPTPAPFRPLTDAERARFVGRWYSEALDAEWRITADQAGGLQVALPRHAPQSAGVESETRLRLPFCALQLERTSQGDDQFIVEAGRARGIRFVRRAGRDDARP